jgi:hypothetical protein
MKISLLAHPKIDIYVSTQETANKIRICKSSRSPGIDSANLSSLAGRYDTLFAVPSLVSIPVLLKRLQIRALKQLMRK